MSGPLSSTAAGLSSPRASAPPATRRASFTGLLRGELRKIRGLRTFWAVAGVMTVMVLFGQILLATEPNASGQLRDAPLVAYAQVATGDVAIVRVLSGILALILAAHLIGLEYQQGTIRILLGRGVGRLQLLCAKALALALVVLAFMAVELLIELAFAWGISVTAGGSSQPWRALTAEFWADMRVFAFYLLINAAATLLLGIAASVVGRSLAFGLAVGLSWFAVDNLLTIPLGLVARLTGDTLWLNVSGLLLGPLLNRLPDYIAPPYHVTVQTGHGAVSVAHTMSGFGPLPLISVSGGHALLVMGLWSALFAGVAIMLTARRDVLD
jgi:ABC-2 type transport system permease protein